MVRLRNCFSASAHWEDGAFQRFYVLSRLFRSVPESIGTDFWYRSPVFGEFANRKSLILNWLPPRDSNPDMLIQRLLSWNHDVPMSDGRNSALSAFGTRWWFLSSTARPSRLQWNDGKRAPVICWNNGRLGRGCEIAQSQAHDRVALQSWPCGSG
jgi:hypothetical protein